MTTVALIACHDCDLLHRKPSALAAGAASCRRCGATLYRVHPDSTERALAFTLGSIVLFLMANVFPIVGLSINGELVQTTLFGTVRVLWNDQMRLVAALVLVTTILMPLAQLAAMACLLVPLRFNVTPRYAGVLFRAVRAAEPWGMLEVFMLGVLVALVKLAHIAEVVPGVAAWCFGALMLVLAATAAAFDPREVWTKMSVAR